MFSPPEVSRGAARWSGVRLKLAQLLTDVSCGYQIGLVFGSRLRVGRSGKWPGYVMAAARLCLCTVDSNISGGFDLPV